MKENEREKYLSDIQFAIKDIKEFTKDVNTYKHYKENKLLMRATERLLLIIGEAMNNVLRIDPSIAITDARKVVNLRNFIIHAYDNVVDEMIWGILKKQLPVLEKEVNILLENSNK